MRFRTLVVWALFLGVLIWAASVLIGAGSSYFAAQELVDSVIQQTNARRRTQAAVGSPSSLEDVANEIRSIILSRAREHHLELDPLPVVQAGSTGLRVQLKWTYPAITYGGQTYLSIPLSLERSISPGG